MGEKHMDDTGFGDLILFAVELIMAAALISIIALFSRSTSIMATARSDELIDTERVVLARKFLPYDGQEITGGDAIALLRECAIDGGQVTVTLDKNRYNATMSLNGSNYADSGIWSVENLTLNIDAGAKYSAIIQYYDENVGYASVSGIALTRV
jgi:hypothetical protein